MANINLIPASYTNSIRIRRTVKRTVLFAVCIAAMTLLAALFLETRIQSEAAQSPAKNSNEEPLILAKRVQDLTTRKTALEKDEALLNELRANDDIAVMLNALDFASDGDVWLNELRYLRQLEQLDQAACTAYEQQGGKPLRYSAGVPPAQPEQCWKQVRALNMQATAASHTAMGKFLNALRRVPGLIDVRFVNSTATSSEDGYTIAFVVSAVIDPARDKASQ